MKTYHTIFSPHVVLCTLLFLVLFLPAAKELNAAAQEQRPAETAAKADAERFITIDFDNVDIRLFIKYISELTGKNFIVDRTVQGNVTIISPTKISEEEAYRVFESVLEVHGFTTVPAGSAIKIMPSAEARSQNIQTLQMGMSLHPEDKVVTQLVPLKHSSPEEMQKVLTPLLSKASVLIGHTRSGMLIITETLSNIQRLLAIIEMLDVEFSEEELAVLSLEHATAVSLAKIIDSVFKKGAVKGGEPAPAIPVRVVPYERVNSLIVLAGAEDMTRIKRLVELLDTKMRRGEGNIHVFYLQNATAAELAKVLSALPEQQSADKDKGKAPAISQDVRIMADDETNALIITASPEEYHVLEEVIEKLDIPRRMVYLEALILEVDTTKDFDVGVEWAAGGLFADDTGQLASGFSSDAEDPFGMLSGVSGTDPNLPNGFSFGVVKQGIKIGNVTFPNIGAILRAYKNDSDIDIISTPQILTTDNKKAEISVGENVPYITSQNESENEQNYTQYEYKDVATKLTITPHINQADTLRLEIETEIIKLKGSSLELRPSTFKRTANTTVIVNDHDTVVIGGIIGTDTNQSETKVPLLGDIPGLGWLFKSQSTSRNQTNMFIFITPRIIRNPAEIAGITREKEGEMTDIAPRMASQFTHVQKEEQAMLLVEKGFQKLQEDHIDEAQEYFQTALQDDPGNPYALINMGVVSERQGNTREALHYYQSVITLGSKDTATSASDPEKRGAPLVQIAMENIERLQSELAEEEPAEAQH